MVNDVIGEDILENYDLTNRLDVINNISITQDTHDILTPKLIEKLLLQHIPHVKLIEIEKCGHWIVVKKPNEMNRIAYDFFDTNLIGYGAH